MSNLFYPAHHDINILLYCIYIYIWKCSFPPVCLQRDYIYLKQEFIKVYMSSVYFLLHSPLPCYQWADPTSEEQRARVIYATLDSLKDHQHTSGQYGGSHVFVDPNHQHMAFDISELTFDVLSVARWRQITQRLILNVKLIKCVTESVFWAFTKRENILQNIFYNCCANIKDMKWVVSTDLAFGTVGNIYHRWKCEHCKANHFLALWYK